MPAFSDILGAFARRPGVAAAALVNADGLPIDTRGARIDVDAVAALSATMLRHGLHFGDAVGRSAFRTLVLEFDQGLAVIARLDEMAILVVLLEPDAAAGTVLAELHRLRATGVSAH